MDVQIHQIILHNPRLTYSCLRPGGENIKIAAEERYPSSLTDADSGANAVKGKLNAAMYSVRPVYASTNGHQWDNKAGRTFVNV